MKNRPQLSLLLALVINVFFASAGMANMPSPAGLPKNCQVLFVQVAKHAELAPNPNQPDSYNLILKSVEPYTSYFTDRPNRFTGLLSTANFVSFWQNEVDIQKTPPNVAVETSNLKNGQRINQVLVLSNPIYDAKKHVITYAAKSLEGPLQPMNFGYTVLFIDDMVWHGNKFGHGK